MWFLKATNEYNLQYANKILTLLRPMGFSIKLYILKSGWSIVYILGSQVIISKDVYFFLGRSILSLVNSADQDEMPHYAAFHLGLHCFKST